MHTRTTTTDGHPTVLRIGPTTCRLALTGAATDGALDVVEMRLDAGWEGPPLHRHGRMAHTWYVVDGEVALTVGATTAVHAPGDVLWVPPGTPHGFSTADSAGATLLQVDTPGTFEGYLRELAATFPAGTRPDPAAVAEVMARHDTFPG